MTWYKAWRETRCRILWALFVVVTALWFHLYVTPLILRQVAESGTEAVVRLSRLMPLTVMPSGTFTEGELASLMTLKADRGLLALLAPFVALLMAGSGINTQTGYAMRQGVHPSMIYTLSLPVSRTRWLGVRAGLGWIETALLIAAVAAIPPATSFLTHGIFPWAYSAEVLPSLVLGSTVVYALAVLLATFLDELWHSMISMTMVGVMLGVEATTGGKGIFSYMMGGTDSLRGAGICVAVSAALFGGAMWVIRRREF
jgi:hypothetical protein